MVGIAVVGAGYWGPNLIRNFAGARGGTLVAVVDLDEGRLARVRRSFPWVRTTTRLDEVLGEEAVHGVAVATPAGTHYDLTRRVLEAGKSAFVEKPLALTAAQCEDLIATAARRSLVLMVGHTMEYNAAVLRIEEYIRQQELGEVYYIYSQRLNLGVVRRDVNAMWNLAPHDISIAVRWLGEMPRSVNARGYTYLQPGVADVVYLNLEFASGVAVHIHVSWLDPGKVRRTTVVGSRKMAVYDDASQDARIQLFDKGIDRCDTGGSLGSFDSFGTYQLIRRAGDVLIPNLEFTEPLGVETAHFVECVQEGKRPTTDGENGLRVVRVLEAADRSMAQGGVSVPVE
ncbi:MAG: Gfo/Idh/MocA family oxidoreductase [Candidatus Latescibacterota bacterium]